VLPVVDSVNFHDTILAWTRSLCRGKSVCHLSVVCDVRAP